MLGLEAGGFLCDCYSRAHFQVLFVENLPKGYFFGDVEANPQKKFSETSAWQGLAVTWHLYASLPADLLVPPRKF